ncbi:unnamed protein product [Porites evermanni]|uniref:FH2 domain-containing protein n=1 Tax=Porites evermanni TaxID=104178 RepID=A0ABN8RJI5_9CNID|nr:unnamed protein product [Porites evermanni]
MNEKEVFSVKDIKSTTQDVRPNIWNFMNNTSEILKCNWKMILPFTLAILLFSAAFFTKKDITFAVNIWIFPGFAVLIVSFVCSEDLQRWIALRHQDFMNSNHPSYIPLVPPVPPPPPPPPFSPPPPPSNTIKKHKWHKIDCRKLSWETLSPDLLNQDTIWKKVGKNLPLEGIFDCEDIRREFSIMPSQGSLKKAKRESAMSDKKIFNISIVMSHHKLKTEDVALCLISGTSNLTSDVLRQLLAFAPDDREAKAIRKQERENEPLLEPAERFYLEIAASVPSYKERMRTVLLKSQFQERIAHIKPYLQTVITASQELMSSEKLTTFIELLLTMGNIMNGSEACAFKITFVTKLMDYKSSMNKRISVLDYLTKVIITKCPHIAALEEDLKHVQQASRVPLKSLDKEITELTAEIEVLEEDVKKINNESIKQDEDAFRTSIELFTVTAKEELNDVLLLRKAVKREFHLLVQYFGEESIKPEELFGIFATLLRQFEVIGGDSRIIITTRECVQLATQC